MSMTPSKIILFLIYSINGKTFLGGPTSISSRQNIKRKQCFWRSADFGRTQFCPFNYILTGHCGSGYRKDCFDRHGRSYNGNMIQCCYNDLFENDPSDEHQKLTVWGDHGEAISCDHTTFVCGTCGSALRGNCYSRKDGDLWHNKIQCCSKDGMIIDRKNCFWHYGSYGSKLSCPKSKTVTGICGSGISADCDKGREYHGIECCGYSREEDEEHSGKSNLPVFLEINL